MNPAAKHESENRGTQYNETGDAHGVCSEDPHKRTIPRSGGGFEPRRIGNFMNVVRGRKGERCHAEKAQANGGVVP